MIEKITINLRGQGGMNQTIKGLMGGGFIFAMGVLEGCATVSEAEFPTVDSLTPGIFLEPAERAVLPPGTPIRKVYSRGIELTKASEGFRSRLYNDAAGYCTIGFGHLLKKSRCNGTEPTEFRNGVSEPQGAELLRKDMTQAEISVMTATKHRLTDGQYAALCDFVFNVGSGNLRKSSLLKAVNARQYDRVPGQFLRWTIAGKKVLKGLKKRREKEIELFFEGLPVPRAVLAEEDLAPIDILTGEEDQ
ncbi:MAG: lysozyme [Gammaproteobacteria bacterium]